jgi:hypothetical protein
MNGVLVAFGGAMGGAIIGLLYVICAKVSHILVLLRHMAERDESTR